MPFPLSISFPFLSQGLTPSKVLHPLLAAGQENIHPAYTFNSPILQQDNNLTIFGTPRFTLNTWCYQNPGMPIPTTGFVVGCNT